MLIALLAGCPAPPTPDVDGPISAGAFHDAVPELRIVEAATRPLATPDPLALRVAVEALTDDDVPDVVAHARAWLNRPDARPAHGVAMLAACAACHRDRGVPPQLIADNPGPRGTPEHARIAYAARQAFIAGNTQATSARAERFVSRLGPSIQMAEARGGLTDVPPLPTLLPGPPAEQLEALEASCVPCHEHIRPAWHAGAEVRIAANLVEGALIRGEDPAPAAARLEQHLTTRTTGPWTELEAPLRTAAARLAQAPTASAQTDLYQACGACHAGAGVTPRAFLSGAEWTPGPDRPPQHAWAFATLRSALIAGIPASAEPGRAAWSDDPSTPGSIEGSPASLHSRVLQRCAPCHRDQGVVMTGRGQ